LITKEISHICIKNVGLASIKNIVNEYISF